MESLHQKSRNWRTPGLASVVASKRTVWTVLPIDPFSKQSLFICAQNTERGIRGTAIVHARSFMMDQIIEHLFRDLSAFYAEKFRQCSIGRGGIWWIWSSRAQSPE